jgi:hypothetical protein
MAEAAGKAEEGAKDEVDVVRAAIYFLAILLVGLGVVLWVLQGKRDEYRRSLDYAAKSLPSMAARYDAVRALLKQYKDSGADDARNHTLTWLQARYLPAGIQIPQVAVEKWNERPSKDYIEYFVDVIVKGVPESQAVHFLWNVEKVSPKMRTIETRLTRTPPNNAPETDLWELKATFGYRVPRGMKEGG